ncbi:MAG: integrase [Verrucomicrobiota bacterium]
MSQTSKNEYIEKMRSRYQQRGREGRSRLLDELTEVCSVSRKHAIKLMNRPIGSTVGRVETRGRKAVYGEQERKVLKVIWLAANQPCGKLLQPMIETWLPHYEREHGRLGNPLRRRLKSISARSIDRLLAPVRAAETRRRNCGTKPGTLIKSQIPIRTDNDDIKQPGYVEADTVAHCGNRLEGDFLWTVDLTDVHTQWTECRAVWNKGQHGVVSAIKEIEGALPFDLLGFDSDNGSEFLNWHLVSYLQERGEKPAVAFTRSRPYRKNDNARVEQKNWTHARQLLGYERLGDPDYLDSINDAYRSWCTLKNFFVPVMKLTEKTWVGGKYRKKYDAPKTPADRLLDWEGITGKKAAWIRRQKRELNPFELQRQVEASLGKAFELKRQIAEKLAEEESAWEEQLEGPRDAPAPPPG